ncbi:hypothetical protein ACX80O_02345 [Arthrobacter sp. Hz1]
MAEKNKKVRMVARISGTRDGKDWPAPGESISLPEEEALALLANGMAVDPSIDETATTPGGVETATTAGNRSVREATASKAAADKQAAERAKVASDAADAQAKRVADAAAKSEADAKAADKGTSK